MAFKGFQNTGPACCCCRDIWGSGGGLSEVKSDKYQGRTLDIAGSVLPGQIRGLDYEAKKAVLYQTGTPNTIAICNTQEPFDVTVVANSTTSSGLFPNYASMDRENQKIYFSRSTSAVDSRQKLCSVNYDGTSETTIGFLRYDTEFGFDYSGTMRWLAYNRLDGKIYYLRQRDSGTDSLKKYQLWRINADATGDTMLYECAHDYIGTGGAPVYTDDIPGFTLDYTNECIWFPENIRSSSGLATKHFKLHRMSFDGSIDDVVIDRSFTNATFARSDTEIWWAQWSHKDQRVYTQEFNGTQSTDEYGGFISYDKDGGDRKILLSRKKSNNSAFVQFFLWCGFEKTGQGTEA